MMYKKILLLALLFAVFAQSGCQSIFKVDEFKVLEDSNPAFYGNYIVEKVQQQSNWNGSTYSRDTTFTPASSFKFSEYIPTPDLKSWGSLVISNRAGFAFIKKFPAPAPTGFIFKSMEKKRVKISFLGSPSNTTSDELAVVLDVRRLEGSGMVLEFMSGNPITGDFDKETITLKKQ
jgi:hypothetical protein